MQREVPELYGAGEEGRGEDFRGEQVRGGRSRQHPLPCHRGCHSGRKGPSQTLIMNYINYMIYIIKRALLLQRKIDKEVDRQRSRLEILGLSLEN